MAQGLFSCVGGETRSMAQPAQVMPPPHELRSRRIERREPRFELCLLTKRENEARRRAATFIVSMAVHAVLIVLGVLVPILMYNALPAPGEATRAFFAAPPE